MHRGTHDPGKEKTARPRRRIRGQIKRSSESLNDEAECEPSSMHRLRAFAQRGGPDAEVVEDHSSPLSSTREDPGA